MEPMGEARWEWNIAWPTGCQVELRAVGSSHDATPKAQTWSRASGIVRCKSRGSLKKENEEAAKASCDFATNHRHQAFRKTESKCIVSENAEGDCLRPSPLLPC